MKINIDEVRKIEREKGLVSLYSVLNQGQFLYKKAKAKIPDKILLIDVQGLRKVYPMQFITQQDFEELKKDLRFTGTPKTTRKFVGRPYNFCLGCKHEFDCSPDIPCRQREDRAESQRLVALVKGDDRFWQNGKPKKGLILCRSSRYLARHRNQEGVCQKEKCHFYDGKNCILNLYKE